MLRLLLVCKTTELGEALHHSSEYSNSVAISSRKIVISCPDLQESRPVGMHWDGPCKLLFLYPINYPPSSACSHRAPQPYYFSVSAVTDKKMDVVLEPKCRSGTRPRIHTAQTSLNKRKAGLLWSKPTVRQYQDSFEVAKDNYLHRTGGKGQRPPSPPPPPYPYTLSPQKDDSVPQIPDQPEARGGGQNCG